MLDENLPVFFLKQSGSGIKHHRDLYLSHQGCDPEPVYSLQNADPASTSLAHKNCYAAAIFDSFNPDVLYGEVLARPAWTQPTLNAEELRKYEGVAPPPQPILPNEFVVQLYNPDQQVRIQMCPGKWGGSDSYEFSLPQSTFRTPSASNLDRGQSDPASLAITPKLNFVWRKESKLSKDLTCFMVGRSTDAVEKKKSRKDPDIAVALWRSLRELTIYEPNIGRLQLEDPKGLDIVLLLSAIVIKDLFFTNKEQIRGLFNVSQLPSERKLSGGGRKLSNPNSGRLPVPPTTNDTRRHSLPRLHTGPPPIADPRTQWELDAETARLRAQAEAEANEQRRRQKESERAEETERRRLQKMVEEEERQARRRQSEIDRETERLRKKYGNQQPPNLPPRPLSGNFGEYQRPPPPMPYQPPPPPNMPYQHPPSNHLHPPVGLQNPSASSPSLMMMSGGNPGANSLDAPKPAKKKSFFRLRSTNDD